MVQLKYLVHLMVPCHSGSPFYHSGLSYPVIYLFPAHLPPGVYISMDSYSDMNMKMEEQSKELQEQILYIRAVKEEKDRIEGLFTEMAENLKQREEQLARTNTVLANTKSVLKDTKKVTTKYHKLFDSGPDCRPFSNRNKGGGS